MFFVIEYHHTGYISVWLAKNKSNFVQCCVDFYGVQSDRFEYWVKYLKRDLKDLEFCPAKDINEHSNERVKKLAEKFILNKEIYEDL